MRASCSQRNENLPGFVEVLFRSGYGRSQINLWSEDQDRTSPKDAPADGFEKPGRSSCQSIQIDS